MSYCLKCKKKTNTKNISYFKSKNNRVIQKGTCSVCGSKKTKFISKHKHGGDIQKFLSRSKFTTTAISGELHLPGYSFCGPGTNLDKRLDEADNPNPWSKPINRVDEVCMRHDIDYGNTTTLEEKHNANSEMLYNLSLIQNPTLREKVDRFIVKKMISMKLKRRLGTSKHLQALMMSLRLKNN